jgi:hypothetical protein
LVLYTTIVGVCAYHSLLENNDSFTILSAVFLDQHTVQELENVNS